jgi:hypothetical protein
VKLDYAVSVRCESTAATKSLLDMDSQRTYGDIDCTMGKTDKSLCILSRLRAAKQVIASTVCSAWKFINTSDTALLRFEF